MAHRRPASSQVAAARRRERVALEMRGARPVARRLLVPGAVVYARVPFADGTGWKSRPAVVVETQGENVSIRPLTSLKLWRDPEVRRDRRTVVLRDWERAGLSRPSAVAPRTVVLERIEVTGVIGRLSDDDLALVITDGSAPPAAARA